MKAHRFFWLLWITFSIGMPGIYAQSISAGGSFSLVICADSSVIGAGWNHVGQLGDSSDISRSLPTSAIGLSKVIKIAAGDEHSLAILEDSTLLAWGNNNNGQLGNTGIASFSTVPVPVVGLSGIIEIAAGEEHSLALRADGTVWAWGDNVAGQIGDSTWIQRNLPVQVMNLPPVKAIACGGWHSMAVDTAGYLWTWGYNWWGQLGNQSNTDQNYPDTVYNLPDVVAIGAGAGHSLAVKADGSLWAWGDNREGQLGIGIITGVDVPVDVAGLTDAIDIDGGLEHSIALKNDGTVWAWGRNANGQLGKGVLGDENMPIQVPGIGNAVSVDAGYKFSMARLADTTVLAWGGNFHGQLGLETSGSGTNELSPVEMHVYCLKFPYGLPPVSDFTGMDTVDHWTFTDRSLNNPESWLWDFGDGQTDTVQHPEHTYATTGAHTVCLTTTNPHGSDTTCQSIQVSCAPDVYFTSADSFLVLQLEQTVYGEDSVRWDFGDGNHSTTADPVHTYASPGTYTVCLIGFNACGSDTVCHEVTVICTPRTAFDHSRQLLGFHFMDRSLGATSWAWEFGNGQTSSLPSPPHLYDTSGIYRVTLVTTNSCGTDTAYRLVRAGLEVNTIDGGHDYSVVRCNNSLLWSFGRNYYGQLGDGTTNHQSSPVQVQVSAAEWFSSVKTGESHVLALHYDGTVWAWGNHWNDRLGFTSPDPTIPHRIPGLTDVIAIDAGYYHSLALKKDGTVWGWGSNFYSVLMDSSGVDFSVPAPLVNLPRPMVDIATGDRFSLALDDQGNVWAWGFNSFAELGQGNSSPTTSGPVKVMELTDVIAIEASDHYAFAITQDSTLWGWGFNSNYPPLLGDSTNTSYTVGIPIQIPGLSKVVSVRSKRWHTLVLDADGQVWSFGHNNDGQCGIGSGQSISHLKKIRTLSGVKAIAAGLYHSVAIQSGGDFYVWGSGDDGALGLGNVQDQNSPQVSLVGCSSEPECLVASAAGFSYAVSQDTVMFTDLSLNAPNLFWDFGDGNASFDTDPTHVYPFPGKYDVCLTADNGACYDQYCQQIVVGLFVQQDTAICSGDSILLGGAYRSVAGLYYDTLSSYQGTDSIVETELTVQATYFVKDTVYLPAGDSLYVGGDWQTTTGTYTENLTSQEGCDSIVQTHLIIAPPNAIADPFNYDRIKVYPNPSQGIFMLEFEGMAGEPMEIQLFDIFGKVILTRLVKRDEQKTTLALSGHPSGIYYLRLSNNPGSQYQRAIVIID